VNSLEIENNEDDWQAKNEEQNEKNNPKSVHVVPLPNKLGGYWFTTWFILHDSG